MEHLPVSANDRESLYRDRRSHRCQSNPVPGLKLLSADEASHLVALAGIPIAAAHLADNEEEAVSLAQGFGYPVVLKVSSPDLPHNSDVRGVHLNLKSDEAVRHAYKDIMASVRLNAREARVEGVTVSPMARPGGLEVILGVVTDPQYGPTLMFGLGGFTTELFRDVAFCLIPADDEELASLIKGIKAYPLLTGYRGQPPRDLEALKTAMKALSILAQKHQLMSHLI